MVAMMAVLLSSCPITGPINSCLISSALSKLSDSFLVIASLCSFVSSFTLIITPFSSVFWIKEDSTFNSASNGLISPTLSKLLPSLYSIRVPPVKSRPKLSHLVKNNSTVEMMTKTDTPNHIEECFIMFILEFSKYPISSSYIPNVLGLFIIFS